MAEMKALQQPPFNAKQMCDLAMLNLAECYAEIKPGSTVKNFLKEVMDVVKQRDNPAVVDPVEIVMQFFSPEETAKGLDWVATQPSGAMLISAAYCARAILGLGRESNELTWSNTANAMFWCGVANSRKRIDSLIVKVEVGARAEGEAQAISKKAKKGAAARNQSYEPFRAFSRQYIIQQDKKWSSRTQAANAIVAAIKRREEYAALADVETRPPTPKTVRDYLTEMPDLDSYFPPK